MHCNSVDFPAPFCPTSPTRSPGMTVRSTLDMSSAATGGQEKSPEQAESRKHGRHARRGSGRTLVQGLAILQEFAAALIQRGLRPGVKGSYAESRTLLVWQARPQTKMSSRGARFAARSAATTCWGVWGVSHQQRNHNFIDNNTDR